MLDAYGTAQWAGTPARREPIAAVAIAPTKGDFPGVSAPLAPPRPVSIRCPPAKWSPLLWYSDRTIENRSARCACRGNSSVNSNPGTFVRMGFQIPRYSAGASGFMSYMSMCPGPPSSQIRMTDVFLPPPSGDPSRAFKIVGNPTDAIPARPTCTKLRRVRPSQYRPVDSAETRNIASLLALAGKPPFDPGPAIGPSPGMPLGSTLFYMSTGGGGQFER